MAPARGVITTWSRAAAGLGTVAVLVPAGAYRWAALALALAGAALAVAATRVPREAWTANVGLLVALACAVGAIWVAEFFPFDERFTAWERPT